MSNALKDLRFRLQLDAANREIVNDLLTGAPPQSWNGLDTDFEFALFQEGVFVDDLSNIDKVYMHIHAGTRDSAPLIEQYILGSALDNLCTLSNWNSGASSHGKHGAFTLTAAEAIFSMAGAVDWKLQLWVAFYAKLTSGKYVTNGVTQWTVEEDTEQTGLSPTGTILTNMRTTPAGITEFKDPDSGLWYPLWVKNGAPICTQGES